MAARAGTVLVLMEAELLIDAAAALEPRAVIALVHVEHLFQRQRYWAAVGVAAADTA